MLRGTEKHRPLGWTMRGLILGTLAGAAVLVSTLGTAAKAPPPEASEELEPFDLSYLAAGAKGWFGIRPAIFMQQPGMDKLARLIDDKLQELKKLGVSWPAALKLQNIEQIVTDWTVASAGTGKPGSRSLQCGASSILIRLNQDFDWPAFFKNLSAEMRKLAAQDDVWKDVFEEVKEVRAEGVTFYRVGMVPMFGPMTIHCYTPDRRSVLVSFGFKPKSAEQEEAEPLRRLIRDVETARKRDWGAGTKIVSRAPLAVVVDNHNDHYAKIFANDLDKKDIAVLEKIRFIAAGVELGDGRPVRLIVQAKSADAALELEQTAENYVKLLKTSIAEETRQPDPAAHPSQKVSLTLLSELLQSRQLRRDGDRLEWLGYSSVRVRDLLEHGAGQFQE